MDRGKNKKQSRKGSAEELVFFCLSVAAVILLIGSLTWSDVSAAGQQVGSRIRPVRDDVGFSWNASSMKILVDYLAASEKENFRSEGLVAAISPHDDYLLAGRVYYPLFNLIRTKEVVIFGVTHGTVRQEIKGLDSVLILDDYDLWPGVLKPVQISPLREYIKKNLKPDYFVVNSHAHQLEHSIEALLPFLQYFNPEVKITPIMVAPMPLDKMEEISSELARVIANYMKEKNRVAGRDIFFLISADGNHYGQDFNNLAFGEGQEAWEKARDFDQKLISSYMTGIINEQKVAGLTAEFWGKTYLDYKNSYWCGKYSIPFGLLASEKIIKETTGRKLRGELIRYSDSYSEGALPLKKIGLGTTAPFSLRHWVSYAAIGYYLDQAAGRPAE